VFVRVRETYSYSADSALLPLFRAKSRLKKLYFPKVWAGTRTGRIGVKKRGEEINKSS